MLHNGLSFCHKYIDQWVTLTCKALSRLVRKNSGLSFLPKDNRLEGSRISTTNPLITEQLALPPERKSSMKFKLEKLILNGLSNDNISVQVWQVWKDPDGEPVRGSWDWLRPIRVHRDWLVVANKGQLGPVGAGWLRSDRASQSQSRGWPGWMSVSPAV